MEKGMTNTWLDTLIKLQDKIYYLESTKVGNRVENEVCALMICNFKPIERLDIGLIINNLYRIQYGYHFIPMISTTWKIIDNFAVTSSISYLMNFPGFNDLYWPEDGFSRGNPDLKPEDGLKWQTALLGIYFPFYMNLNYSENYINNNILWKLNIDNKWMPENIGYILSRTGNVSLNYEDYINYFYIKGTVSFSINYSINNDKNSIYYQKRIIYTPLFKTAASILIKYLKNYEIEIGFRNVSERYTTEPNTVWLPPYYLFNISLRIYFVFLSIDNLMDYQYEEVEGYPQMGRYIKGGVYFEI